MNLLAHLYIAELTGTSAAGQLLGDMVKGHLHGQFTPEIEHGIRLHRAIDSFTDSHPITADLRRCFKPPLRRYGGILVDIGFDYCLARQWPHFCELPLPQFAQRTVARVGREWPVAAPVHAPGPGLAQVLVDYQQPTGLQRALDSVDYRLKRASPLPDALPALLKERETLAHGFEVFFPALCNHALQYQ